MDRQPAEYPAPSAAWTIVAVLTVTYMLSFIDRYLLSLLIAPIKTSMDLSDFQVGLLLGPAFAVFYATMGMPIGWAADRVARTRLIALGMAVWCLATAATGLVSGFPAVMAMRILVGAGEAVLAPCALSLIADCFPPERRGPPVSVYMSGTLLGAGAALAGGGLLVALVETLPPIRLPIVGAMANWQALFVAAGLSGLVVVVVLLLIGEPRRHPAVAGSVPQGFGAFLVARRTEYGWLLVGMAGVVTLGYTAFWNVAVFERNWDWSTARTGVWLGTMVLLGGVPGAVTGGQLIRRLDRRMPAAATAVAQVGVVVMLPGYLLFGFATNPALALAGVWLAQFGQGISTAAGPSAVVALAPAELRARAAALYWMAISLTGLLVGPTSVGLIADRLAGDGTLGKAIAIVAATVLSISIVAFARSRGARAEVKARTVVPAGLGTD